MSAREPLLRTVPITELRPTQITVGMREVEAKRRAWRAKAEASDGWASDAKAGRDKAGGDKAGGDKAGRHKAGRDKAGRDKAGAFLGTHMIPVILGPKRQNYVIDHHHLCRALFEEGQEGVLVNVVANLQRLEPDAFWFNMDCRGWMHPFDEDGVRRGYGDVPKSIMELRDDPFRSLAGELRLAGGYAKDTTPFSEFLWADFLRRRLKAKAVVADFDTALAQALNMAKSGDADFLPGWCGAVAR